MDVLGSRVPTSTVIWVSGYALSHDKVLRKLSSMPVYFSLNMTIIKLTWLAPKKVQESDSEGSGVAVAPSMVR